MVAGVVWMVRRNDEVIAVYEQDAEDFMINGRGHGLAEVIPLEDLEYAIWSGEWSERGYEYHIGEDDYLVTFRVITED